MSQFVCQPAPDRAGEYGHKTHDRHQTTCGECFDAGIQGKAVHEQYLDDISQADNAINHGHTNHMRIAVHDRQALAHGDRLLVPWRVTQEQQHQNGNGGSNTGKGRPDHPPGRFVTRLCDHRDEDAGQQNTGTHPTA